MSHLSSHGIGPDGWKLPLSGWSLTNGDIRISHLFGIHAMQALPLLAGAVAIVPPSKGKLLFATGAFGYLLLTVGLIYQATHGRPPL